MQSREATAGEPLLSRELGKDMADDGDGEDEEEDEEEEEGEEEEGGKVWP